MSHKKSLILRKNKYWDYKKARIHYRVSGFEFFCFQMGIAQNLSDIVSFCKKYGGMVACHSNVQKEAIEHENINTNFETGRKGIS